MDLPRILPDRQRTEPVLFCILIHDDIRKTGLGEKADKLAPIENPHPINDRKPFVGLGIFSVRLIDDQKDATWPQGAVHLPEAIRGSGPEIYGFKCGRQIKRTIPKGEAGYISLQNLAAAGLQTLTIDPLSLFYGYF